MNCRVATCRDRQIIEMARHAAPNKNRKQQTTNYSQLNFYHK